MEDRDAMASSRFSCTDRERALFEAGIKMGTIYHQFVGTPVNLAYVVAVQISIDRSSFVKDGDRYSYKSLTGEMIDAVVSIAVGDTRVTAEMRYDETLRYPLMYISDIC